MGAMVALVRTVTETFGATLGAALIYSVAAVILWIVRRPASLRKAPRRYLLLGGLLFRRVRDPVFAGTRHGE